MAYEPSSITVSGLHHSYGTGDVLVDVDLEIKAGTTMALLGPSGCGKTTLLRSIAGLERPRSGTISIDDRCVTGPSTWVPPEKRRVGLVFQDWALFPHLDVAGNVGYGLPRSERREGVAGPLEMVGLAGYEQRMPATLSGGQQQRVALARALAPRPRIILLDEPFSNLDASRRVEVRADIRTLLGEIGTTAIFVTHDQDEAFVLGDRVTLMREGRVVQVGTPQTLYERPVDRWAAEFVGDAISLAGVATGSTADTVLGPIPLDRPHDGPTEVLVRPEHLRLIDGQAATVQAVEYYGHDVMVHLRLDDQLVKVRTPPPSVPAVGDRVGVTYAGRSAIAFADQEAPTDHDDPVDVRTP